MPKIPLSPFLLGMDDTDLLSEAVPSGHSAACAEHMSQPGASDMMALGPADLFVVASVRSWAAPLMRPDEPHPDWRELFRLAQIGPAGAVGFDALMSIIGARAQRLIDVHCCRCPTLGEDERGMLRLVAALQVGNRQGAVEVLADWLPEEAIGPALDGARCLAAEMVAAGLLLARTSVAFH